MPRQPVDCLAHTFEHLALINPVATLLTQMGHAFIDPAAFPAAPTAAGGYGPVIAAIALIPAIFALGWWFFTREAPPGPPVAIELRTGDHPMTIETADGAVRTRSGAADEPDLVLTGDPQPILGLLSGYLEPAEACDRGVQVEGDLDILDRLRPQAAVTAR